MQSILIDDAGAVRVITINRPERLNALDEPCRVQLRDALETAATADEVRAVVLTGSGRAFCTGQDVAAAEELVDAGATVADTYNPLARALRSMPKPVVAAINGPAVGAGLGLALSCDIRVMADSTYLACSFSRVALVPDTGTSVVLVRQLGHAVAFETAASGRRIGAEEAVETRLVNRAVALDDLDAVARQTARELAEGPAEALALTKRLFVRAADDDEDGVLDLEAAAQGQAAASEDHREAVAAFLSKSKAKA